MFPNSGKWNARGPLEAQQVCGCKPRLSGNIHRDAVCRVYRFGDRFLASSSGLVGRIIQLPFMYSSNLQKTFNLQIYFTNCVTVHLLLTLLKVETLWYLLNMDILMLTKCRPRKQSTSSLPSFLSPCQNTPRNWRLFQIVVGVWRMNNTALICCPMKLSTFPRQVEITSSFEVYL